jgi:hypothetical protein
MESPIQLGLACSEDGKVRIGIAATSTHPSSSILSCLSALTFAISHFDGLKLCDHVKARRRELARAIKCHSTTSSTVPEWQY